MFYSCRMNTLYEEVDKSRGKLSDSFFEKWFNIVICYYCEICGTFGRSNTSKDNSLFKIVITLNQYKQIEKDFKNNNKSTEHGTGWCISKEEFNAILFEVML